MIDEEKLKKERIKTEKFNRINERFNRMENTLKSIERILSGNELGTIDSFNIGTEYFYGEEKKRLLIAIKPELDKMYAEAQIELEKYFEEEEKQIELEKYFKEEKGN